MRFDAEGNLLPEIGQAEELAQEAPPLAASGAISAEQLAEFETIFSDSPPESEHVAAPESGVVTASDEQRGAAAPLEPQIGGLNLVAPYGYNALGYPRKHPEPSEAASNEALLRSGYPELVSERAVASGELDRLLARYSEPREDDPWYDTGGEA